MAVSSTRYGWLPWLVPIGLALSKLRYFFIAWRSEPVWRPQVAPALLLVAVGCALGYLSGLSMIWFETGVSEPSYTSSANPPIEIMIPGPKNRPGVRPRQLNNQGHTKNHPDTKPHPALITVYDSSAPTCALPANFGKRWAPVSSRTIRNEKAPEGSPLAKGIQPIEAETPQPITDVLPLEVDEVPPIQVTVYIRADANGDGDLADSLITAFAKELATYEGIVVVADNSDKQAWLVHVKFAPKIDCHGIISADLYDSQDQDHPKFHGDKTCYELPKGKLLEDASKQLVAGIISTLRSGKQFGDSGVQ